MRLLPDIAKKWLLFYVVINTVLGGLIDHHWGNKIDYWIHDAATVFKARQEWKYSAIAVLDNQVPMQVGRKQALPLFARATEYLHAAGAKGVFLDARVSKNIEGVMPYALCIETNGAVRWSSPICTLQHNQCQLLNSQAGNAPLKMQGDVFSKFRTAPYLSSQSELPNFLLYGWEAESKIPESGLVALDRLVTKESSIGRWMDLSEEHAVIKMAKLVNKEKVEQSLQFEIREKCNGDISCRRIRFSQPHYGIQFSDKRPILPVSQLASCDHDTAQKAASLLRNKIVILQLTTPSEATDVVITPMTTALFGPQLLTPGAQYLADSIETLLNNDHPREPDHLIKKTLFLIAALISVYSGAYLKQIWLLGIGGALFIVISLLCFLSPVLQLWPVTATMLTFIAGALLMISIHLIIGFREGTLVLKYMPQQVHSMLLALKENESFRNQRYQTIVLMSDMAGYTKITSMLNEPAHVLELMNDYLEETSFVLQQKYQGWLETYIGDMVCYYWPFREKHKASAFHNALRGALELSQLQKRFFSKVTERYKSKFENDLLEDISHFINAGIGLSCGTVVMGDLGPKHGVRKFGILGDPMNLTARIESLTRHFNTEIIVTEDFIQTAKKLNFPIRRLGCFCVKGREQPESLYTVGLPTDIRFQSETIERWENWLAMEEKGGSESIECPEIFQQDYRTLKQWRDRGLLKDGIWHLDEK